MMDEKTKKEMEAMMRPMMEEMMSKKMGGKMEEKEMPAKEKMVEMIASKHK